MKEDLQEFLRVWLESYLGFLFLLGLVILSPFIIVFVAICNISDWWEER